MQSLFWFLVSMLLVSGVSSTVTPPESLAGSAFLLNYREGTAAAGGAVGVTFVDVVEDSRCPANTACTWAGQVEVALEVQVGGNRPQVLNLGGITDNRGVLDADGRGSAVGSTGAIDGYEFQLLSVTPYPATAAPPQEEQYQVSLVVRAAE
jgi:hypothetical protein